MYMCNSECVKSVKKMIQQAIQYIAKGWKVRKRKNIVIEQSSTSDKVTQSIKRQSEILVHTTN